MGWFYGFKLHLIVNERGELLSVKLTQGNVDDRKPLPDMCQSIIGKIVGDKGYISQALHDELLDDDRARRAHSVRTAHDLRLERRVPDLAQQEDVRDHREVEPV